MTAEAKSAGPLTVLAATGRRVGAMVLVAAALGLPINHLLAYAFFVFAAVLIFNGQVVARLSAWLFAIAAALVPLLAALVLAPTPIAEGDNVFLAGEPGNVLERGLPGDAYKLMLAEVDALYPPAFRCKPDSGGCWANTFPERTYAFAADGLFAKPLYSRSVTAIDFSDPVWLRLGFVNDLAYNWSTDAPDVHRMDRNRAFWMGLHRWNVTMPWFAMFQFPAAYVGASLCWGGDVLWPGADEHYTMLRHATAVCRELAPEDVGRKIFGVAIRPATLAVTLHPPLTIEARRLACAFAGLLAVIAVVALLVRARWRDVARPLALIGLALIVIAIDDASFIGGWRPMDGGDDGLFYTGMGRLILQHLLDGNVTAALIGGENVYFYGGPGLRYFRALEMIFFGDTNLGYLSLILAMPIIVHGLLKRFLSDEFAWRLAVVFTAVPIGAIFGTSYFHYVKWAARGFADPAAHILLIWGIWVLVGPRGSAQRKAAPAAGAALLMALAIFIKPIVAVIPAVMLGGAGLGSLAQRQWPRLAGMCVGFLPVLLMPLHNWYFGHAFVLFSANVHLPGTFVMEPAAYLSALLELMRLDFSGRNLHAAIVQIAAWLREPSETWISIPMNVIAVPVVVYVAAAGRDFDPWLRLIAAAVIGEYIVDLFYAATARYFFEMWLLTAVVATVFVELRLPAWLEQHGWQRAKSALEFSLGYPAPEPS